jgi:hypothetical protein
MLGVRGKGARPREVILLDSLGPSMLGIALHVSPPKGMLRSHETIFPCKDGTFPAVYLPLLVEEMLLQLIHHCRRPH